MLDSLGPIFTCWTINIPLDFQNFQTFSIFWGLDSNLSFVEAAIAL